MRVYSSKGGIYLLTLSDWYAGSYNIMIITLMELIGVCYVYGESYYNVHKNHTLQNLVITISFKSVEKKIIVRIKTKSKNPFTAAPLDIDALN